jgi:DNA-directed RNA polymerase subunit RPC12/RpoP
MGEMKCERCGSELELLDICESGRIFECSECAYTITLLKGRAPQVNYSGPLPLDYYFHD